MAVKLDIKKQDGEYCVRWIEDGKRIEAKCYYTDDADDARETLRRMNIERDIFRTQDGYQYGNIKAKTKQALIDFAFGIGDPEVEYV